MKKSILAISSFCVFVFGLAPVSFSAKGIPHLSRGVGIDERETLSDIGKADNLKLIFALNKGNYLSNVAVLIKDLNGKKVLEAVSDGPWFFTKLPTGQYPITATTMGESLHRVIQVPPKGQTEVYFSWNASTVKTASHSLASKENGASVR